MPYDVEVSRTFRAVQGLPSRVRSVLPAGEGVPVVLCAGVSFTDSQVTDQGWFFDTDVVSDQLERWATALGEGPWTARFTFRPTFELVARHVFHELAAEIRQLAWVELRDTTFGTRTRYTSP